MDRRDFLRQVAAAGSVAPFADQLLAEQSRRGPNDKINIGVIGVANRGAANLAGVAAENVVALCDVDANHLDGAKKAFPQAGIHHDFRKLLDDKRIEAVVVSTPDHMHAIPAVMAMRMGRHVYCEKPLAHSVHEVRVMTETAASNKIVTQMGTQIHAGENYRRVVELVRGGVIGKVPRVHVWLTGAVKTGVRVKEGTPPATLDYDLWLGPAPYRPYHPSHLHFNWRYWWDFGNGLLGDFGCHYMDLPFWALGLSRPTSVVATGRKDHDGENDVPGTMQVDYQFPAREGQPPVHLTWYHGKPPAEVNRHGMNSGVLFVGEEGEIVSDYSSHRLMPEEKFADVKRPERLPSSPGHHKEWLNGIRGQGEPLCHFGYSGPLAETVLLGNVSYRTGQPINWDGAAGKVTNNVPQAASLIERPYRKGWTL